MSGSCCSRPAGPDVPPNVHDASIWYTLLGSDVDWKYFSEPQAGLDGRKTFEPRGKLPGGSSDFYIMMHIRGHPSDYDGWAAGGATGWSYQDCLPYFQKLENQEDDTSPWAGHGGPLPVNNAGQARSEPDLAGLHRRLPRARLPADRRLQRPEHGGRRLAPHQRRRRQAVRRLPGLPGAGPGPAEPDLRDRRARHEADHRGRPLHRCRVPEGQPDPPGASTRRARSSSAAARSNRRSSCCSPGSAIPTELEALGIEPIVDLPGVGKNFHNHVLTGVIHESPQPVPPGKQNLSESALFVKSDPAETGPDLQIAFVHVPVQHHRRPGPPELDQHPAGCRPTAVARDGEARERRSDRPSARRPELPGRPERPREAGQGGQDLARDLRDQGVRTMGRRRS